MFKRCPISPKLRFRVLQRDGHRCQYCGARAPGVPLEIDHIRPVSAGGRNVFGNLLTACFDCNRGKHAREVAPIYVQKAGLIGALRGLADLEPFGERQSVIDAVSELLATLDALGEATELAHKAQNVEEWLARVFQRLADDLSEESAYWRAVERDR